MPAAAGAVLFGRQPGLIGSRCSRLSYGVKANICVDNCSFPRDGPNVRVTTTFCPEDGLLYYADKFCRFVRQGQAISIAECVCQTFIPQTSCQTEVAFDLWATDNNEAHFITEDSMHQVSCMTLIKVACSCIDVLTQWSWNDRCLSVSDACMRSSAHSILCHTSHLNWLHLTGNPVTQQCSRPWLGAGVHRHVLSSKSHAWLHACQVVPRISVSCTTAHAGTYTYQCSHRRAKSTLVSVCPVASALYPPQLSLLSTHS